MNEAGGNAPNKNETPVAQLVHYGATSESVHAEAAAHPVAVMVCHGMGQQVRYETISGVANAIAREAMERGGQVAPAEVHLAMANDDFLARAELHWTDSDQTPHEVHVYEAYWAPLTEGKVTYTDTLKFLAGAAWNGLWHSRLFRVCSFGRWMFGKPQQMTIGRMTFLGLLIMSLLILLQAIGIAWISLEVASWLKTFGPGSLKSLLVPKDFTWWKGALWLALAVETFVVRYFLVEFVGDVAAYISPYKDSKFDELRSRILAIGLNVGKVVYGFGSPSAAVPPYAKVVMVGHSLGSVLAYDTLNSLINLDNVADPGDRRGVVTRTRALLTFGSPLDKTAFIFRMQMGKNPDWLREQLSASMQPLVLSYADYRPAGFDWINIWSPLDIVSGSLDYYDAEDVMPSDPRHVKNMVDKDASVPLYAHVQYWGNEMLRQQLYDLVS